MAAIRQIEPGTRLHVAAVRLPPRAGELPRPPVDEGPRAQSLNAAVDSLKQRMILDAIAETGSKTRAAEQLGIPRQSLQKMMKRLGIS